MHSDHARNDAFFRSHQRYRARDMPQMYQEGDLSAMPVGVDHRFPRPVARIVHQFLLANILMVVLEFPARYLVVISVIGTSQQHTVWVRR